MHIHDLFERRAPRQTLLSTMELYANDPSVFVNFTDVLKLGINPQSDWDDPLAVYAYPIAETFEKFEQLAIPFAGDRRYAFMFRAGSSSLELQDYDEDMFDADLQRIERQFKSQIMKAPDNMPEMDPEVYWDHAVQQWIELFGHHPGKCFWEVTSRIARHIVARNPGREKKMVWNALIRACNYDAVIDRGEGIISTNEPAQGCFINVRGIRPMGAMVNDLVRARP